MPLVVMGAVRLHKWCHDWVEGGGQDHGLEVVEELRICVLR